MRRPIKLSWLLVLVLLASCRQTREIEIPFLPGFGPHKIEIQQGNVVTQDMLEKLQPGMTRNQVRFVLGTPLIVDPFRNDRWDYVYVFSKGGERVEQRQLRVFFKDDRMVRYEGDVMLETPATAAAKPGAKPAAKPADKPPAAAPAAKTEPVAPEPAKPVDAAPATVPATVPAAVAPATPPMGDPKLRLSPETGQPATPEERAAAPAAAPAPAATPPGEPQVLETPPLPRMQLPPEEAGATAREDAKPQSKPQANPADAAADRRGFLGRLLDSGLEKAANPEPGATPKPSAEPAPAKP